MTKSQPHHVAVRPIGFERDELSFFAACFADRQKNGGILYHALHEDDLHDPDLYLVNAASAEALATLSRMTTGPLRPALLIGCDAEAAQRFPASVRSDWPANHGACLATLDDMAAQRLAALAGLQAFAQITVPERRRRLRAGQGVDQRDFSRVRRRPATGGILVVDKNNEFNSCVSRLLGGRGIEVNRANDEKTATVLCRQLHISLVLVNTSTPDLDPYRLCDAVKGDHSRRISVVFLVGRYFVYSQVRGREARCDGFVTKPMSEQQLTSLLEKFLPLGDQIEDEKT